ncbi:hypothetical protein HOG17_05230 [Candidatus Peregrinibacteria bacterium]|jgi:hypothetical protein|nr:hypothetical protein [Candidatus Peregrinibacteria bacterium]MBT4148195.1 hypothetical protein [Candidatus Peregrinibacteria bacterium]MBT4365820.1 hypothetical protein [Candidatus Peregrinibacteria bacterium]MBT4455669.1 hypothetical protein [Candidatus Peregrinibacteria bacterium]
METKPKVSLKKILGFLLSTVIVVGALYYYGLYRPAYEESRPPQIMSDSAFQGLLIDKTTKFFKFEYSDVANWEATTDHYVDVPGGEISFYYSVEPISAEEVLRSTYPVPGMKVAYADYMPDLEKMFHVYPDVSAHSNSRPITIQEGDDYMIPAFRGFALIAFEDTRIYNPYVRGFEDVPTQEEIDAAYEAVLEEMAAAALESAANSSEGENGTASVRFGDLNTAGNRTVAAGADFCPEFPIPFEEEDWILLPVNEKNVFKKVMNCINSKVSYEADGSGEGYEAKYIWLQTGVNEFFTRLDEDGIDLADEDTFAEVGESGYSMVWFKIDTYSIAAPDPDPIMCSYDQVLYEVGETFDSADECNTCSCGVDGVITCTDEICDPDPDPITCTYNEVSYEVGDIFDAVDECNTCACGDDGGVICGTETCEQDPDPVAPQVSFAEYVEDDLTKVIVTFDKEVECSLDDKAGCFTVYLNEDSQDVIYIVVDAVPLVTEVGLTASIEWELTVDAEFVLGRDYVAEASVDNVMLAGTDVGVDPDHNTAEFELPDPEVFVNPTVDEATALNKTTILVAFDMPVDCVGDASACFMVEPADPANTPVNVVDAVAGEDFPGGQFPGDHHLNWTVTVDPPGIDYSIEGEDDVLYIVTAMAGIVSEDGAGVDPDHNSAFVNIDEPAPFDTPYLVSAIFDEDDKTVINIAFDLAVKCGDGVAVVDCVHVLSKDFANPNLVVQNIESSDVCDSDYCENWVITVNEEGVPIFPYNVFAPGMESEDGILAEGYVQISWPAPIQIPPVIDNVQAMGTLIAVDFNIDMKGKELVPFQDWFTLVGEDGSTLEIAESPYPYCGNGAVYCLYWGFSVVEIGNPGIFYDVMAPGMESVDKLSTNNFKKISWPVPDPEPSMTQALLDEVEVDVNFDDPVKCLDDIGGDCFKVYLQDDEQVEIEIESFVRDGCDVDQNDGYCEDWIVTLEEEGTQGEIYSISAPDMANQYGETVQNSKPIYWDVEPEILNAEIQGNGTNILVEFNVGMKGQDGISTDQWFEVSQENGATLTVVPDSPNSNDYCINGAEYCPLWLFEVSDTGDPGEDYNVSAPGMISEDGLDAENSFAILWEDELLVLIGAVMNDSDKNHIGIYFSEPVSQVGNSTEVYSISEVDDPEQTLGVVSWGLSDEWDGNCPNEYPGCDVYVLELDENLQSDVGYLVVAKSSTDDSDNYVTTYDGVSIDKDNNSDVVSISYEYPILNVLSTGQPLSKVVEKGMTEDYFAFDLLAENHDITIDGFAFGLEDGGGSAVNFDDFDQIEVWIDEGEGMAPFGIPVSLDDDEYLVDFMTGSDGGFGLTEDISKEVVVKLKISEDAVTGNEHKVVLSGIDLLTPDVSVNSLPISGNLMEIDKDLVTLTVSLSSDTPPAEDVYSDQTNYEFARFDLTAEGGSVVVDGIDLMLENDLGYYGFDGIEPAFEYISDTRLYLDTPSGEVLLASVKYDNEYTIESLYFDFSEDIFVSDGDTETIIVRADIPYYALAYVEASFGIESAASVVYIEEDLYDYEVVGDFEIWSNVMTIKFTGGDFVFNVIEPEDNKVGLFGQIGYGLDLAANVSDYVFNGFTISCLSNSDCSNVFGVEVFNGDDLIGQGLVLGNYFPIQLVFDQPLSIDAGTIEYLSFEFTIFPSPGTDDILDDFMFYISGVDASSDGGGPVYIVGGAGNKNSHKVDMVDRNVQVSLSPNQPYPFNPRSAGNLFAYMNVDLTAEYGPVEVEGLKLTWKYGHNGTVNDFEEIVLGYNGMDSGLPIEEHFTIPNNPYSYQSKSIDDAEFTIDLNFKQDSLKITGGETEMVQVLLKTENPFMLGNMSESVFGIYAPTSIIVNPYLGYYDKDFPITVELVEDDGLIEGGVIQVD